MSTASSVLVCALFLTPAVREVGWHDGAAGKNGIHRPGPLRFDRPSGGRTHPAVSVRIYSHAAVAREMPNQAKEEVARVYREADVRIEWLDADPASSAGRFTIQMIIRRKPLALVDDPHGMGTTLGNEHEDGGTAFVFHDRVLKAARATEQDVTRVLGYTSVHEIGHVLLPRPAHSSTGIMRADWDGDALRHIASRSLTFTPTQVAQIRSKLLSCCSTLTSGGDGGMIGARGRAQATSGLDVTAVNSAEVVARVRSTDATILELLKEGAEQSTSERDADARWDAGGGTTSQSWVGQTAKHRDYRVDDSPKAKKAIADALALLPEDVQMQIGEIIVIMLPDERWLRQAYPVLQAQVFEGDDTIYVAHWGDAFRQAAAGNPVWLVSAIVHEMTHLRNGPDERLAYDAQLATLRRLKAPATLIRNIERAKAVAVDARK